MKLNKRLIHNDELMLLSFLIKKANLKLDYNDSLLVVDLDDGGMGSLRLFPENSELYKRSFGCLISDCEFRDIDGVVVIASLYLDNEDQLYELDLWKADLSRLNKIANIFYDVNCSPEF